jgi:hypothetical protein
MDLSSAPAPPDAGEAEPHHREPHTGISNFAVIAFIALFTWPIPRLAPGISIDGSWGAGLHQAAHFGIAHGSGIDFTYGPFGYLDVARLFFPETAVAAVLYTFAVHVALIAVIFVNTRRRAGIVVATAICLTLGTIALIEPVEIVPLVYFAACAACLRFAPSEKRIRAMVFVGTFLGAFQLLVKFNTGVIVFASAAALVLALPRKKLATLVAHLLGSAASLIALWVLAGQHLGDLGTWLRNSVQIAAGYTNAMATDHHPWEYAIAAAAFAGIALLVRSGRRRMEAGVRFAMYELLLLLLFAEWKHGFVRHDVHYASFLIAVIIVVISLMWFGASLLRPIVFVTLLMIAAGFALPYESKTALFRPTSAAREIKTLVDHGRRDAFIAAGKQRVRRVVPIDPTTLGFLSGRTVHIDPNQVLLSWAYDLDWRPAPIFQTYSAYTPALDRFNAAMIGGPGAPDRILRIGRTAGDKRDRMFESPDYIRSLLCHYRELSARTIFEVVARTANRCGAERSLTHAIGSDRFVRVPKAAADEMVIMRLEIEPSLFERIRSVLYKPTAPPGIAFRDATGTREFRLVEATAGDSLVLCVPTSAGFSTPFVRTACPDAIRVTARDTWSVSFSVVAIR